MFGVNVEIRKSLPIYLALFSNGKIALMKRSQFQAIFDTPPKDLDVAEARFFFDVIEFVKDEQVLEEYRYGVGYDHKNCPHLLAWLQRQELVMPKIIKGTE